MNEELTDAHEQSEDEDFAAMFEKSISRMGTKLEPGMQVEASILQVGSEWTFLDVGQKGEGVLASAEILDEEGNSKYAPEDKILIGFEDTDRTNPDCDNDFNDVVVYGTVTTL